MTWRHLRGNLDRRFAQVRAAILERRDQLVAQNEIELLEHQRKRVQQLNDGLRHIADQANRRVVALLDEYSDLALGGRWRGKRLAMFEASYLLRPPAVIEQRCASVAEVDAVTRCALERLKQGYDGLLAHPDAAEAFEKEDLGTIVDRLMKPALPQRARGRVLTELAVIVDDGAKEGPDLPDTFPESYPA